MTAVRCLLNEVLIRSSLVDLRKLNRVAVAVLAYWGDGARHFLGQFSLIQCAAFSLAAFRLDEHMVHDSDGLLPDSIRFSAAR